MAQDGRITQVTRRAIIEELDGVNWAGRLDEVAFLKRLYDLERLPSTDSRYQTAAQDIAQHRLAWEDWPREWVFFDERFDLRDGEGDETLLRFLAEVVHPVVRPDPVEARSLAERLNGHLRADGWELVEHSQISGRPVFAPSPVGVRRTAFAEPTGWQRVDRQLQEASLRFRTGVSVEHFQAVGLLCREILISVAQEVYDPERHLRTGEPSPSPTDAARMLEAFFSVELSSGSNEEARAHGKAALRFAVALQHQRSANFRTAALCLEATSSVVNLVAILAGRYGQ